VDKVDLQKETGEHMDAPGQVDGSATPRALKVRQDELPSGHPSGRDYGRELTRDTTDANGPDGAVGDASGKVHDRPITALTEAEHAEHVAEVRDRLDDARAAGLATNLQHTTDARHRVWSADRSKLHDEIIDELYCEAAAAPCDGKAIMAGGLPGAGKTTVLSRHAGIDLASFLIIDPDRIKEAMAARDMTPGIEGLTPMEASDLVHAESSHIAKRLARHAYAERKNVIWDVSMSGTASTQARIDDMRHAGYGWIEGIFVDIPIELSKQRADARHREGHELYRSGEGLGGRYMPPAVIDAQADPELGSNNRATFEQVKAQFDAWYLFDNSVDNRPAQLVESSETGQDDGGRTHR
jgi:predicted ABC-type ATPase